MPFLCKFILSLTLTITSVCNANNKVGNGGNVVACKDPKSTQLLDFYEAEIKAEPTRETNFEILNRKFKALEAVAPQLSTQYLKRAKSIESEIEYKSEIELSSIPDSKHLFKPKNKSCEVLQVAVRKAVSTSSEKRFVIDTELWDAMGPYDQAGLLAHEIIYEHLSKLGETDSIKARKLNQFIFSNKDMKGFWKLVKELEIPIYP